VLSKDSKEWLDTLWEDKEWNMQYQQIYTLMDYSVEQGFEQEIEDPTTRVKEAIDILDPTLLMTRLKKNCSSH